MLARQPKNTLNNIINPALRVVLEECYDDVRNPLQPTDDLVKQCNEEMAKLADNAPIAAIEAAVQVVWPAPVVPNTKITVAANHQDIEDQNAFYVRLNKIENHEVRKTMIAFRQNTLAFQPAVLQVTALNKALAGLLDPDTIANIETAVQAAFGGVGNVPNATITGAANSAAIATENSYYVQLNQIENHEVRKTLIAFKQETPAFKPTALQVTALNKALAALPDSIIVATIAPQIGMAVETAFGSVAGVAAVPRARITAAPNVNDIVGENKLYVFLNKIEEPAVRAAMIAYKHENNGFRPTADEIKALNQGLFDMDDAADVGDIERAIQAVWGVVPNNNIQGYDAAHGNGMAPQHGWYAHLNEIENPVLRKVMVKFKQETPLFQPTLASVQVLNAAVRAWPDTANVAAFDAAIHAANVWPVGANHPVVGYIQDVGIANYHKAYRVLEGIEEPLLRDAMWAHLKANPEFGPPTAKQVDDLNAAVKALPIGSDALAFDTAIQAQWSIGSDPDNPAANHIQTYAQSVEIVAYHKTRKELEKITELALREVMLAHLKIRSGFIATAAEVIALNDAVDLLPANATVIQFDGVINNIWDPVAAHGNNPANNYIQNDLVNGPRIVSQHATRKQIAVVLPGVINDMKTQVVYNDPKINAAGSKCKDIDAHINALDPNDLTQLFGANKHLTNDFTKAPEMQKFLSSLYHPAYDDNDIQAVMKKELNLPSTIPPSVAPIVTSLSTSINNHSKEVRKEFRESFENKNPCYYTAAKRATADAAILAGGVPPPADVKLCAGTVKNKAEYAVLCKAVAEEQKGAIPVTTHVPDAIDEKIAFAFLPKPAAADDDSTRQLQVLNAFFKAASEAASNGLAGPLVLAGDWTGKNELDRLILATECCLATGKEFRLTDDIRTTLHIKDDTGKTLLKIPPPNHPYTLDALEKAVEKAKKGNLSRTSFWNPFSVGPPVPGSPSAKLTTLLEHIKELKKMQAGTGDPTPFKKSLDDKIQALKTAGKDVSEIERLQTSLQPQPAPAGIHFGR